jgi:hypothetical protein
VEELPAAKSVGPLLPPEVVCEVLQWFGVAELVHARLVCLAWRDLIASSLTSANINSDATATTDGQCGASTRGGSQRLWRRAYFNTWPLPSLLLPATAAVGTGEPRPPRLKQQDVSESESERHSVDWMAIAIERLKLQRQCTRTRRTLFLTRALIVILACACVQPR